jgi:uncharacterized damage-inducible protein DinB
MPITEKVVLISEEAYSMTIGEELIEHFTRVWGTYRDAIRDIPEEQWRAGEVDYLTPSRLLYHVLEAAEFYSRETPKGFNWGANQRRFGVDWEAATPEQLPTQEQTLTYLDEVQAQLEAWLKNAEDSDILSPDSEYSWTGKSVLGRALYLLRHNQHHLGELNAELRRRGLPRAKWR